MDIDFLFCKLSRATVWVVVRIKECKSSNLLSVLWRNALSVMQTPWLVVARSTFYSLLDMVFFFLIEG